MLVYEGIKTSFINDVDLGRIADEIRRKFIEKIKRRPAPQEFDSWKNSMQYMRGVLSDSNIPDETGIAIEYNIPPTGCRIDFMMSGYNEAESNVIIIELKQWSECTEAGEMDGVYKVNTFTGKRKRDVNHPSYQALSYAELINDFNESVEKEKINIIPCAYLHNYYFEDDDTLLSGNYREYTQKAPLFGHSDVIKLRDFIKKYIKKGDSGKILYEIDNGRIRPSKMLQDSLVSMLQGNQEFRMIDSQKLAYEYANKFVKNTIDNDEKSVFIIKGGPGTGKSVLAINMLVQFNKKGMTCFYVTKNAAPRRVYSTKLKGKYTLSQIKHLFRSSGEFVDSNKNEIDCLIVDEAHRLNAKSGRYGNLGDNQIKEIINTARCSIFFIDEDQRVTLKDIGSEEEIKKCANELGVKKIYDTFELESQFRCNGSDGYIAWLDRVLNVKETANYDLDGFDYDFKVFDDPNELREAIVEKNRINNKSRIVAGYCWEWPSGNTRNDTDVHEIVIPKHNFEISWNLEDGEAFAIGKNTVNEAGCIHTVQGLEFDYVGVIIGDDLRYENGKIITDYTKRARSDTSLNGIKKIATERGKRVADEIAGAIIKNTYRVLMSRGMKGCYIYCTDDKLRDYIKNTIKQ